VVHLSADEPLVGRDDPQSLFINKEALEKGANRPPVPDQTVKKLGVLGAGMMGAGIAYVAANAGSRSC
jgi:3-hydroxyacyl-CoA dehydrogenase / enoyl-CoA hydratase / 3-hydroxybutyryl-CoA epimerase